MWLDRQSKITKIILFIPLWGFLVSAIYRIASYIKYKKDITTLIVGICLIVPFIGIFFSIVDLVTVCLDKELTLFVDHDEVKLENTNLVGGEDK